MMKKEILSKKIAIVGGGPGGLTLARLLQMNGADVKVYERDVDRSVRVQGATLDLHEGSGLKALGEAGLMVAFMGNYRPGADKTTITDKHANILYREDGGGQNGFFRPEIDRGPLRELLLDSLEPGTVVWDSNFLSLQQGDNTKLFFKNGTTAHGDIVIAADGANSKIRPYITPVKPFFAGITVIEGAVYDGKKHSPAVSKILIGGKIFVLDDEKTLIVSAKGDGSINFYAGFKTDEFWLNGCGMNFANKQHLFHWFKTEFAGWGDIWNELFENASVPFIPRPQYCMPLNQTWNALPNLTMLGDAAHLMPPYAGEGVNMAMLDALELAECLLSDNFAGSHEAIAAYEKQMRARASETAQMTLEQTQLLHGSGAAAHMIGMFQEV